MSCRYCMDALCTFFNQPSQMAYMIVCKRWEQSSSTLVVIAQQLVLAFLQCGRTWHLLCSFLPFQWSRVQQ